MRSLFTGNGLFLSFRKGLIAFFDVILYCQFVWTQISYQLLIFLLTGSLKWGNPWSALLAVRQGGGYLILAKGQNG